MSTQGGGGVTVPEGVQGMAGHGIQCQAGLDDLRGPFQPN